jgi:outer membrane receptor protein involved in Fe transport
MPTFLRRCFHVSLLLAMPLGAAAQSQATGGAIEGTITDESGAVLPGASVTVRNQGTGVVREATTDGAGVYRAPLLPVGTYDVTASLAGFATTRRPDLVLQIGQTLTVDLALTVATAQEEVTVTAEAPVIESARTHQASTVGAQAVSNLPVNGRNFIDFVLTTPGVSRDVRSGDISFAGQRGTLNSLVIDGADNNNTFFGQTLGRTGSGRAPYQFSQDAVQEFQVNRNAYSAEYGRAGGAVINVVTKSGTNEFHGSAFEFFRDDSLNANSYTNKVANPIRPKSPFRIHQFGGSLGGPLQKDKAFFFFSYDGQRQSIPNDVVLTLPGNLPTDPDTQAGLAKVQAKANDYERTRDQDVFLAKVDYQFNPNHRLSARYNHQNFTGGNGETSGTTNAEEHSGDSLVRTRTVNASLTSVFSSTLYNEFRAQWANDKEPGEANTNDPETLVNQSGQRVLTFGRNNFSPRETTIKRFQVADTVTWIRGAHSWKGGFDYNHDQILNFFPGFFGGNYTFASLASFNRGVPSGAGESFQQNFAGAGTTGPETNPDIDEFAVFLQDEWRARADLILTAGVRYDIQSFAKPAVRNPDPQLAAAGIDTSFLKTDKNNVAPRLGLAWSPNKRTVVRAGYGLFYGRTPSIMVGTAHSNNGVNVISVRLTGNQVPTYPNVLAAPPAGVAGVRPSIFIFDPDYENPEVHQWSAGVEYALTPDLALNASYLGVAGRKLQRSTDFNIGTPTAAEVPIQGGGSVTVQRFPTARPFANFDRIIRFESSAESTYNGLNLELRRRYRKGLLLSLAYTLGKVEDTRPDATAVVPGNAGDDAKYVSNPADFEADRADGDNDVRHRAVFSGYWAPVWWADAQGATKALLDGWSLSWIAAVQSGLPYAERVTNDLNQDGNRFNDIVPGSRNVHRLPSAFTVDMRLTRAIPLGKEVKLELIAEAFNLLNTTNISAQQTTLYNFTNGVLVPQLNLANPRLDFGADSSTQVNFEDTQRIVQLAAKITF